MMKVQADHYKAVDVAGPSKPSVQGGERPRRRVGYGGGSGHFDRE